MSKKVAIAPACGSCGGASRLTDGREVYPHRPDLHDKPIWKCSSCGAYVGCHPGTVRPLGSPADAALRQARRMLHDRMIDPLWKSADRSGPYEPDADEARRKIQQAARFRVYAFLAERMEISKRDCHAGKFTIEQCREAWALLRNVTYPQIRDWYHDRKASRAAAKAVTRESEQQPGAAAA